MEKWATWRVFCPRNAWSKNRKMGSREKGGLVWGGVDKGGLDVKKRAIM